MVYDFNYDWVSDEVLAASLPTSVNDIKLLYQEGVRTIVSLCEGDEVNQMIKNSNLDGDIRHLIFEIPDFSVPSEEQVREFIDCMKSGKKPVAVHCYAGVGRTGTMIALYLIIFKGMSVDQAIDHVRSRRYGAIETQEQEQFLYRVKKKLDTGQIS